MTTLVPASSAKDQKARLITALTRTLPLALITG
jgi:hypothetical protein